MFREMENMPCLIYPNYPTLETYLFHSLPLPHLPLPTGPTATLLVVAPSSTDHMAPLPWRWPPSLDPWSPVESSWIVYTRCHHHSLPRHHSWECVKAEACLALLKGVPLKTREISWRGSLICLSADYHFQTWLMPVHKPRTKHTYAYTNIPKPICHILVWLPSLQGSGHGSRSKRIPFPDHPQSHGPRHTSPRCWCKQNSKRLYRSWLLQTSNGQVRQDFWAKGATLITQTTKANRQTWSSLDQNVQLRIILIV